MVGRHWPSALGQTLAFRVLNKMAARPGVLLDAVAVWGGRFRCDLQDFVPSRIFYFGVWEPNLTAFIQRRLAKGDIFVDVGANIGYFTVLASTLVGDTGGVVALEASPSTYAKLRDNLTRNRATNVRPLHVAVADRHGTAPIFAGPPDNRGLTSLHADRGGRFEADVPTSPLLDLLTETERSRVRMIKIDVEGAELPILMDLLANVASYPERMEIIVEVSPDEMRDGGMPVEELFQRFAAYGFHWYEMENRHDLPAYFDPRPQAPRRGVTIPTQRTDVVFSRELGDTLS